MELKKIEKEINNLLNISHIYDVIPEMQKLFDKRRKLLDK